MYTLINKLARLCALAGGLALSSIILITCLSIIGRLTNGLLHSDFLQAIAPELANSLISLGIGPINGDFEIVEAGMAFAVFAFIPLCQLEGAHASVDIFTSKLPTKFKQPLITLIEIVFAITLLVIAVQLYAGMQSKRASGQVTFLLEYPIWWAYALSLTGAGLAAVVSIYLAIMRIIETVTGRALLPMEQGAGH
ncbi:MAG: TRAP transporter small permease [Gammaproteobacteria bacterium]|nr:TRAP transporter small permease [Gammaproteobacteria bacterium]